MPTAVLPEKEHKPERPHPRPITHAERGGRAVPAAEVKPKPTPYQKAAARIQERSLPGGEGGRKKRGSATRFFHLLVFTGTGRSLAVIAIAAAVLGLPLKDIYAGATGWGAPLFFVWGAAAAVVLNIRPGLFVHRWKWFAGALGLAFAITGTLGMFRAPIGTPLGDWLGGSLGTVLASAPELWDRSEWDITPGQYALASLRVAVMYAISAALFSPPTAIRVSLGLTNSAIAAYSVVAGGVSRLYQRFDSYRFKKAQSKAQAAGQGTTAEADMPRVAKAISQSSPDDADEMDAVGPADAARAVGDAGTSEVMPLIVSGTVVRPVQAPAHLAVTQKSAPTPDGHPASKAPPAEPVTPPPNYQWKLPAVNVLKVAPPGGVKQAEIDATGQLIVETLGQHGIDVSIDTARVGPTVTMYGLKPGWDFKPGTDPAASKRVRVDTILNREKDLALALKSPSLRFEAPVPGEAVVGIEVPNQRPTPVTVRSVADTEEFKKFTSTAALPVPLGLSTGGEPVYADLAKMPHLLVAGATGSGKSVCINAIITGLLMERTPYQVRMVMIDPKRVELTPYAGIPHLYNPVVVEPGRAVPILRALVNEMMGRFKTLEAAGVKNIASYNQKALNKLPYIVVLVDELADLMLTAAGDTERLLVRLAQLGRATGMHLVVATQRPSVDVVTGLIKANFPSRVSFAVSSQIDSRTVIDSPGAEKLLGRGDMLFLPVDKPRPQRVQGAFLSDAEIEAVVTFWRANPGPQLPQLEVQAEEDALAALGMAGDEDSSESLVDKAEALAHTQKTLSTSLLQRRLRIGYPRAARLMDELEEKGVVGPGEPGKPRQVLMRS